MVNVDQEKKDYKEALRSIVNVGNMRGVTTKTTVLIAKEVLNHYE